MANIHGRRSKNVFRETTKPIYHDRGISKYPHTKHEQLYRILRRYCHDCRTIAKRRIIDKWDQIDVAAELGWYRGAVSTHEKYVFQRVADVAKSLYTNQT